MAFETVSFVEKTVSIFEKDGTPSSLEGPTALHWGPDGKLYVASTKFQGDKPGFDGQIFVLSVSKASDGSFSAVIEEKIGLVAEIPNHDDDGTPNPKIQGRQVTGIEVGGTADNPIVFVTSSDPRVGGGDKQTDTNLDTNSGVLSQLTRSGPDGAWEKLDLVRGLPRSEENHATNGIAIETDPTTGEITRLFVGQGGHTNAGSPSEKLPGMEYAYSAAILSVDYVDLMSRPVQGSGTANPWVYDLPTLDSPLRPNIGPVQTVGVDTTGDGVDDYFYTVAPEANDPFGGEDGKNQAKITPDSPVQIYSPGWRNPYDVVLTSDGQLFSYDNGANPQWGLPPFGYVDGVLVAEEVFDTTPFDPTTPDFGDFVSVNEPRASIGNSFTKNYDAMHHITVPGYYAGHPNPIRASGGASELWDLPGNGIGGAFKLTGAEVPADFAEVVFETNPIEGDYREAGVADGAVDAGKSSINGLAEFTGTAFGGAMQGALLATEYSANKFDLIIIGRNADGDVDTTLVKDNNGTPTNPDDDFFVVQAAQRKKITIGKGDVLGVDALGDGGVPGSAGQFNNTIWLTSFGAQLIVLEPGDGGLAPIPNQDGDALIALVDPFDFDNANGRGDGSPQFPGEDKPGDGVLGLLGPGEDRFYGFSPIFSGTLSGSGLTGIKINGVDPFSAGGLMPEDGKEASLATAGGSVLFKQASVGSARGAENKAQEQYQFGVAPKPGVEEIVATATFDNWMFLVDNTTTPPTPLALPGQRIGMFAGAGDQDNYIAIALATSGTKSDLNGGVSPTATVRVTFESAGVPTDFEFEAKQLYKGAVSFIDDPAIGYDWIQTRLIVDIAAGTATPAWRFGTTEDIDAVAYPEKEGYPPESVLPFTLGAPIPISGAVLEAARGQYLIDGTQSGLAVGMHHLAESGAENINWAYRNMDVFANGASSERSELIIAVNAGGIEDVILDVDGGPILFETDLDGLNKGELFGPSKVFPQDSSVYKQLLATDFANTDIDIIHATERFTRKGLFGYEVPVENGIYEVDLYFAEIFFGIVSEEPAAPRLRLIDVFVEDSVAVDDLDIIARAGPVAELKFTHRFEVTDGFATIGFESVIENAKISAFTLHKIDPSVVSGENRAPVNITIDNLTVAENAVGAVIGQLTVNDPDSPPGVHRFVVSDDRFSIDESNRLVLLDGQSLDFETEPTVKIFITATDDEDAQFTKRFIIEVEDVAETDPTYATPFLGLATPETAAPGAVGAAVVRILADEDDVQASGFTTGSFVVENVGDKKIAAVFLDLAEAVFPDMVFDPDGTAGDTAFKPLVIDAAGGTGVLAPSTYQPYLDEGGATGFRGLLLRYDLGNQGGFVSGESMSFSIDVDPLSIKGFVQGALNGGSSPTWDVGGVSGAELIGSSVRVLFSDGTDAEAALFSDASKGGAAALVSEAPAASPATLTVNGVGSGGLGAYGGAQPTIMVSGVAGQTVRIVLVRGFVQPVTGAIATTVADQLSDEIFQANNAADVQTLDLVMTGAPIDVSGFFNFGAVPAVGLTAEAAAKLPIAFVAAPIDPARDGLAIGPVTAPIYLESTGAPVPPPGELVGTELADRLVAGPFVGIVRGLEGDDVLIGRQGTVLMEGGDGNDRLVSGAGNDTLRGGAGDDTLKGGAGGDLLEAGPGNDRILAGDGDDTIIGGGGDDVVLPGRGDDLIDAGPGADIVRGFRGNETIIGGAGDDTLFGGLDDDVIEGGAGDDRLIGGPGKDRFVFTGNKFGDDRILDFRIGSDVLDFSGDAVISDLGDLTVAQVGTSVRITVNGADASIVLANLSADALLASDSFLF